jgi:hypothetical protein
LPALGIACAPALAATQQPDARRSYASSFSYCGRQLITVGPGGGPRSRGCGPRRGFRAPEPQLRARGLPLAAPPEAAKRGSGGGGASSRRECLPPSRRPGSRSQRFLPRLSCPAPDDLPQRGSSGPRRRRREPPPERPSGAGGARGAGRTRFWGAPLPGGADGPAGALRTAGEVLRGTRSGGGRCLATATRARVSTAQPGPS